MTFGEHRKPLPRMSKKREAEVTARRDVLAQVRARAGNRCEGDQFLPGHPCYGVCEGHEIVQRSAWRAGYLDPDNVLWICRALHDWSHEHVAAATKAGLLKPSWER